MIPRILGVSLLVIAVIPFAMTLGGVRRAARARGETFVATATVVSIASHGVVEVGYLDRRRTPRHARLHTSTSDQMPEGQTLRVLVPVDAPDVAWLEHEEPPGVGLPLRTGLLGFGLLMAGGTLTLLSFRSRTDRRTS